VALGAIKKARKASPATVSRLFDRISEGLALAAGTIVLLLTLLITGEVVARKVLNAPLGFVFELSTYSVIAIVFLPLAFIQAQRRHIAVDLVVSRLSPGKQVVVDMVASVLCLVFCGLLTYKSGEIALKSCEMGLRSAGRLAMPLFIPQAVVPVGSCVISLQFLLAILRDIRALLSRSSKSNQEGAERCGNFSR
jgi:C4-dicarboxylate transporter DctQ subunit